MKRLITNPFTGEVVETTENIFCPTGKGGGIDPTCSPDKGGASGGGGKSFSVGDKVEYKGQTWEISGSGFVKERGKDKGRKPLVLARGAKRKVVYEDTLTGESVKSKKTGEKKKKKAEPRQTLSQKIRDREKFYEPVGGGKVDYTGTKNLSIKALDSVSPEKRSHILAMSLDDDLIEGVGGRSRSDFQLNKVRLKSLIPVQHGEDRINVSSKTSARSIKSGDLSRIAQADIAPIMVSRAGKGKYTIEDGHHRFSAAELNGQTHIYAWVPKRKNRA